MAVAEAGAVKQDQCLIAAKSTAYTVVMTSMTPTPNRRGTPVCLRGGRKGEAGSLITPLYYRAYQATSRGNSPRRLSDPTRRRWRRPQSGA